MISSDFAKISHEDLKVELTQPIHIKLVRDTGVEPVIIAINYNLLI